MSEEIIKKVLKGFKGTTNKPIDEIIREALNLKQKLFDETLKNIIDEIDENKAFPKDIFLEVSDLEIQRINEMLKREFGFSLDRLSAFIGRKHYKNIKQIIQKHGGKG